MFRECGFFVRVICAKVGVRCFPFRQTLPTALLRTASAFLPLWEHHRPELAFRLDRPLPLRTWNFSPF
jgi:hypothetical protein